MSPVTVCVLQVSWGRTRWAAAAVDLRTEQGKVWPSPLNTAARWADNVSWLYTCCLTWTSSLWFKMTFECFSVEDGFFIQTLFTVFSTVFVFLRETRLILCFYIKTLCCLQPSSEREAADEEDESWTYSTLLSDQQRHKHLWTPSEEFRSVLARLLFFLVLYFELSFKHFNDF